MEPRAGVALWNITDSLDRVYHESRRSSPIRWSVESVDGNVNKTDQRSPNGFLWSKRPYTGSPRVHPSHSPTLALWRSPSRSASTTSTYFKDALEHLLEDAAWGLCSLRL